MTTLAMKNLVDDTFNRLFSIMVGVSAVAHVLFFIGGFVLPPLFTPKLPDQKVIQIEMIVQELPKGAKIGTQAPSKSQTAARAPDHSLPWKKKPEKLTGMAMKKAEPKIKSKRLNYKQRKQQDAIDRIRKLREVREGGGGTGTKSGGNVFAIYVARVKRRIEDVWVLPPGLTPEDKASKVRCQIKIGPNGSILSAHVIKSSGLAHLDRSASAAISAAGTLPQPPPLIAKELAEKGMIITFDPLSK